MIDNNFTRLYDYIKSKTETSDEYNIIAISWLRVYLIATKREDIIQNFNTLKLHIRTFAETFLSLLQLIKVAIWGLFSKKSSTLILIIEPTHLKQMQGMCTYFEKYSPIFLTTKRNYIDLLKSTFKTARVVFIPTYFINTKFVKQQTIEKLYKDFDINLGDDFIKYITKIINDQVANYRFINFVLNILLKFHPIKTALVFNDLTTTGRTITYYLNKKKITTCYVMHGLLSDEYIENLHIAKCYFIFGEYTRPILVKHGIDNNKIHTIGAPYLDYYRHHQPMGMLKNMVLNKHTNNKSIALVLLSGRGHTTSSIHHNKIINLLNEVIEESRDQYYFVFKLHKKDYIDFYQLLYKNKNIENNFAIYPFDCFNSSESIFDWLSISDLIITGASTTALEAMYLKKPVITVDLMAEYENETQYIQQNGTYHCRSKNELLTNLHHLKLNQFTPKSEANDIALAYFSDGVTMHKFFFNQFTSIIS